MSGGGGPVGGLGLLVVLPHGGYIMFGLSDGYIMFGSTAAGLCFTFKADGAALYTGGSSEALTCDVLAAIMLPIRPVRVASCMLNCCSSEGGAEDDDDGPLPESSCCIS